MEEPLDTAVMVSEEKEERRERKRERKERKKEKKRQKKERKKLKKELKQKRKEEKKSRKRSRREARKEESKKVAGEEVGGRSSGESSSSSSSSSQHSPARKRQRGDAGEEEEGRDDDDDDGAAVTAATATATATAVVVDPKKKAATTTTTTTTTTRVLDVTTPWPTSDRESPFQKQSLALEVPLLPIALEDLTESVRQSIDTGLLLRYHPSLGGVLLAYDEVRFDDTREWDCSSGGRGVGRSSSSSRKKNGRRTAGAVGAAVARVGMIRNEHPHIHYKATVSGLVFCPRVGLKIVGNVTGSFPSHLGILAYNFANVTVSASELERLGYTYQTILWKKTTTNNNSLIDKKAVDTSKGGGNITPASGGGGGGEKNDDDDDDDNDCGDDIIPMGTMIQTGTYVEFEILKMHHGSDGTISIEGIRPVPLLPPP